MSDSSQKKSANDIAIIGMSSWYPGARTLLQNWENILAKRRQFRRMLDSRLPLEGYYDPDKTTADKTYGRFASYIEGFDFDWMGRRIPKTAFESTDVVQWLALEVALKAMEDAKFDRQKMGAGKSGVIVGNSLTGEWARTQGMRMRWPYVERSLLEAGQRNGLSKVQLDQLVATMEPIFKSVIPPVTEDTLAGNLSNTIAGRIANFLDLGGGGYTVDGACSSSLIAVATAANALVMKDMDLVVAGGVDISLDTFELIGFAKVGALAKDAMKVYDRGAQGFIPGEGCGFVVMRRLEDALRDGNTIYAVLKGWGISSDGKGGITAPSKVGQSIALERAYEKAGYTVADCDFIEGHGTGTFVGDRVELEGISIAMSHVDGAPLRRCGMTSYKSLVGHTKAAAGVGAFIKAAIAVNRRVLPPLAGTEIPNATFAGVGQNLYPILMGEVRPTTDILRAGVSAMGFGGINCHVTLQSYGEPSRKFQPTLSERALLSSFEDTEILILSASSLDKMKGRLKPLLFEAERMSEAELTDFACELGRKDEVENKFRAAILARTPEQFVAGLKALEEMLKQPPTEGFFVSNSDKTVYLSNSLKKTRLAFLYPGQGSQQINMARDLVERFEWAQDLIESSREWLKDSLAAELIQKIHRPTDRAMDQSELDKWSEELSQTEIAQPGIVLASALWTRRLNDLGLFPSVVGGHSLGELSAFHAAGVLTTQELIQLAALRGQLMAAPKGEAGTMASLSCSREQAEAIISKLTQYAVIANINSPKQIVISGTREGVDEALKIAGQSGISGQKLRVSNAFHSKIVASAAEALLKKSQLPIWKDPICRLRRGIDGTEVQSGLNLAEHFSNQIVGQVDFVKLVEQTAPEADLMVEVGPGQVLSNLCGKIFGDKGVACMPVEGKSMQHASFKRFLAMAYVHGHEIRWEELYKNRLIRPYISFSERSFVDNPLEREFPTSIAGAPAIAPAASVGNLAPSMAPVARPAVNVAPVPRPTSQPAPIPLNLVKPVSVPAPAPVSGPSAPAVANVVPFAPRKDESVTSAQARLVELVAEKTGFAQNAIQLQMRLLDDLNLDSIKAGEIVATLARELEVTAEVEASHFANATLQEILSAFDKLGARSSMPMKMAVGAPVMQSYPSQSAARPTVPLASAPKPVVPYVKAPAPSNKSTMNLLKSLIAEKTGFAPGAINEQMRLLDDLNLDSIKAGEIVATLGRELGVSGDVEPSQFANATLSEIVNAIEKFVGPSGQSMPVVAIQTVPLTVAPVAEAKPAVPKSINIMSRLQQLIADKTGFSTGVLKADLRLLDDLNMDSIKAGEIIATMSREFQISGEFEPAQLANATLHEIASEVERRSAPGLGQVIEAISSVSGFPTNVISPSTKLSDLNLNENQVRAVLEKSSQSLGVEPKIAPQSVAGHTPEQLNSAFHGIRKATETRSAASTPALPEHSTMLSREGWVRDFEVRYLPENRKSNIKSQRLIDQWPEISVLMLAESLECPNLNQIKGEILSRGAQVKVVTFNEEMKARQIHNPAFSHIVGILPAEGITQGTDAQKVRRLVDIMSCMSTPPPSALGQHRQTTVAFVQFGGGFFGEGELQTVFGQCGARSIAQSLCQERSDLRVRVIDVSTFADSIKLAKEVAEELVTPEAFEAVGYDAQLVRHVPVPFVRSSIDYQPRPVQLERGDLLLVTGGAKGITFACAEAAAKKFGVRLALIGSSPLEKAEAGSELSTNLANLSVQGIEYRYYSCDIANGQALEVVIQKIHSEMGPVHGVLHGAGLNKPRRLEQANPMGAYNEIAPKVQGILNLKKYLQQDPLKIVTGFTSILGVANVAGNGWYGFSNEILNLLVRGFKVERPQIETVTMAFGMWDEVGMAAKLGSGKRFEKAGVGLIPKNEGVKRFLNLMANDPGTVQTMVVPRLWDVPGWNVRRNPMPEASRFLEKIITRTDGVEVVAKTHLSLTTDLYLLDHCYKGSYLFPTVFGLEAMAQAAALVTGISRPEKVCFEKVELERPIVVDPKVGADIEVYAEILEKEKATDPTWVKVGVRTLQTLFKKDHFSALVSFDALQASPPYIEKFDSQPLILEPKSLYGWLLFHGPRYQRLQKVHRLNSQKIHFSVQVEGESENAKASFSAEVSRPLILGDPYLRDSILQAGQLVCMKARSLPIRLSKLEIFSIERQEALREVDFDLIERDAQGCRMNSVILDGKGGVSERLTTYQSRILEQVPGDPSSEELANSKPEGSVVKDFKAVLREHAGQSIKMAFAEIPQLNKMNIEQRHVAELKLIDEAYQAARIEYSNWPKTFEVHWRESGKPEIKTVPNCEVYVSVAHVEDFCLAVVSSKQVGCDLEIQHQKSLEAWKDLLGSRSNHLEALTTNLNSIDLAGTATWTTMEAFGKAVESHSFKLDDFKVKNNCVIFRGSFEEQKFSVVSVASQLPGSLACQVAFATPLESHSTGLVDGEVKMIYAPDQVYTIQMSPEREFIAKWPVTFRDVANVGRGLFYTNFFKWQGQVRELAMSPIMKDVTDKFEDGAFGMVTNYSETKVLGEAMIGDVIEVHFSLNKTAGREENTMDTVYDWRRRTPDGRLERIAYSKMGISWVKVKGHGLVELAPWPDSFKKVIDALSRKGEAEQLPEPLRDLQMGPVLYEVPAGTIVGPILNEKKFETALEESNLVGNIYFSNYPVWQGKTRDYFLRDVMGREVLAAGYSGGELICLSSGSRHLREAMPFDTIEVVMSLRSVHVCGVKFQFDYYRCEGNERFKLATGYQDAIWVRHEDKLRNVPSPLPETLKNFLLQKGGVK